MPRKNLIRTNLYPYHIVARSNNKEWFYLPIQEVWDIFCGLIAKAQIEKQLICPNYVLMNNHFHMLVWTPLANIDSIMQYLMKNMSDQINFRARRVNHVFGGPYKWTLIDNDRYYWNVIRYICQNPLRASLVQDCFEYPYLHLNIEQLPLSDFHMDNEIKKWINSTPGEDENLSLKRSLTKTIFKVSINRKTGKPFQYDTLILH